MTVMGDASMEGLSDAGSTPARSMEKNAVVTAFFCFRVAYRVAWI